MLCQFPGVFVDAAWVGIRIQEEEETSTLLYVGLTWILYFYLLGLAVCLITKATVTKSLQLKPCYCQCFILLYIVPEGPWNPYEMIYDNLRHLTIHLEKKNKTIFLPGFLRNLAARRHHDSNLSRAVCWCVLTMLFMTDGVLCWKHPAVVLLTWQR